MTLHAIPLNILIYEEIFILFFISVEYKNLEIKSVILGGMEQSYPLIKKATLTDRMAGKN
jgi:hypothetical protein